ncbi:unannotated protein [freshwater metagenome]|uniref:Unannotated protein n=1 Tax=freshwater metagenome TaxID=449393 RepID=A0A6J6IX38_9ZZZZ
MLATGIEDALDRFGIGDPHPDGTLHEWFENDRSKLMGVGDDHRHCGVGPSGIVVSGGAQHPESEGVEHVGSEAAGTDGDRSDRVAVIGATECEIARAAGDSLIGPELESDLQCLFDGSGAVGREQEMRFGHGHPRGESLGKFDRDPVAVAEHRGMGDPIELLAGGLVEFGNVMAEGGDPERGDRIEVTTSVYIDEFPSFRGLHDDRLVVDVARHLREPVPDDGSIAGRPPFMRSGQERRGLPVGHPGSFASRRAGCWRSRQRSISCPIGVDGGPLTNGQISSARRRQLPVAWSSPNIE